MWLHKSIRYYIVPYWRTWVVLFTPLLLIWLPIYYPYKESKAAYGILLISTLWMTESLPLPITSLLPVLLFPMLGIMDTETTTTTYMKESSIMVIGEIFLAEAVEHCNLHMRIAYGFIILFGPSPRWFLLGTMLVTAFLCMWICNAAVMVIMVPVVEAIVKQLYDTEPCNGNRSPSLAWSNDTIAFTISPIDSPVSDAETFGTKDMFSISTPQNPLRISIENSEDVVNQQVVKIQHGADEKQFIEQRQQVQNCLLLSIVYSAHLGSTGTMIGASPNLALKGILSVFYGTSRGVNFATWMAFTIPYLLINLFVAWLWLQMFFLGFKRIHHRITKLEARQILKNNYDDLGPFNVREIIVLALFFLLIILWALRDQEFLLGWGELIRNAEVGDCTALMIITIALFVIPSEPQFCFRSTKGMKHKKRNDTILNWNHVRSIIPWATIFLLGGGFATSYSWVKSKLWNWLMESMEDLSDAHPVLIILVACILASIFAEIINPTATANIFLPILAVIADVIKINPLALLLPVTISTSLTFMLPVSKKPISGLFSNLKIGRFDMIKVGCVMNIVSVVILCLMMGTYGTIIYNIQDFPEWAHPYPGEKPDFC